MKQTVIKLIKFYQKFISPNLGRHCRFYPSCSSYAMLSIEKYGLWKGCQKGIWRIMRCNPWNPGGVDLP